MKKDSIFSKTDLNYMQQAITLAAKGLYSTKPNPAVGCLLVKNNLVIGQGWHKKYGMPHAERVALTEARKAGLLVQGATAYITLEPCVHFGRTPPCTTGLIEAGIKEVFIAMLDPNPLVTGQGIQELEDAGISTTVGLLEQQAKLLNLGFIRKMKYCLPFVRLKMASSIDGRTAMAGGHSQWITGAEARFEVHKMRAACGALVTGIGTVLADNPSLTVRLTAEVLAQMNLTEENCHPLRVVLDPHLSMPIEAKMLSLAGRTIIMTSREAVEHHPELVETFEAKKIELVVVSAKNNRLDIHSILHYLAEKENISDVMIESGAIVAGAFMESGLVNELHSFVAPSLLGDSSKSMFVLPSVDSINNKIKMKVKSVKMFGDDVRIILIPDVVKS